MSSKEIPVDESEKPTDSVIDKQLDTDNDSALDDIADKVADTLVHNPAVLERVMSDPSIISMVQHRTSMFEGPLPPPSMLAEYEDILPGAAERILSLTEKEQSGRLSSRDTALNGEISKDTRGQWMGFVITFTVLVIASVFAWRGNTVFAGTLIAIDLIGLATVFVIGRQSNIKD